MKHRAERRAVIDTSDEPGAGACGPVTSALGGLAAASERRLGARVLESGHAFVGDGGQHGAHRACDGSAAPVITLSSPGPLPTPGRLPVRALVPVTGRAGSSGTTRRAVTTG